VPQRLSAGLLPFRVRDGVLEVFLVHPGGPFWARKDEGAWSIAKGEHAASDDPRAAACRELQEETGFAAGPELLELGELRQPSGKRVRAWGFEADLDPQAVVSNTFELEWPKGSGKIREFPEVDRAGWFALPLARRKLLKGQVEFLDRLVGALGERGAALAGGPDRPGDEPPEAQSGTPAARSAPT
jgi:predicted NUDIX family NTP pyrophosphohydrolase